MQPGRPNEDLIGGDEVVPHGEAVGGICCVGLPVDERERLGIRGLRVERESDAGVIVGGAVEGDVSDRDGQKDLCAVLGPSKVIG